MNRRLATVLVALSVVAGTGIGYVLVQRGGTEVVTERVAQEPSVAPTSAPVPDPTPAAPSEDAPGTVAPEPIVDGAATDADYLERMVGMNRRDRPVSTWKFDYLPTDENGTSLEYPTLAPGGFQPVVVGMSIDAAEETGYLSETTSACEGLRAARWAGRYSEGMDVLLDSEGRITSLGLSKDGPETSDGISVNSSLGALKRTYGDRLIGPRTMEGGASGYFFRVGDDWLGFAFPDGLDNLTDRSRIIFIEATVGDRPGLFRADC